MPAPAPRSDPVATCAVPSIPRVSEKKWGLFWWVSAWTGRAELPRASMSAARSQPPPVVSVAGAGRDGGRRAVAAVNVNSALPAHRFRPEHRHARRAERRRQHLNATQRPSGERDGIHRPRPENRRQLAGRRVRLPAGELRDFRVDRSDENDAASAGGLGGPVGSGLERGVHRGNERSRCNSKYISMNNLRNPCDGRQSSGRSGRRCARTRSRARSRAAGRGACVLGVVAEA